MVSAWSLVLFVHVTGAALWVGGQLTLTLVVMPLATRLISPESRAAVMPAVGRRFARITLAVFLPVQAATGVALAAHAGVTWESLAEPGYGRTLAAKLALVVVAMAAAAGHSIAAAKGRPTLARAASVCALVCSLGVVLLATALSG
jgi:uncharacterized membrane protein